jgi:ER membrane protein complex subunit 1
VQLWTQGELKWAREESLTKLVVAEFVELPEQAVSESVDGTGKGFFARIIRQLFDAQVGILNPISSQSTYLRCYRTFHVI